MEDRVSAALMAVERVDPTSGSVLRAKISEQEVALSSFEGNNVQAHVARILTTSVVQLAAIASNSETAAREALAITSKLAPILDRLSAQEAQETSVAREKQAFDHEARIKELETRIELAKSRENLFKLLLPILTTLTSALTAALTWWVTGSTGVTP